MNLASEYIKYRWKTKKRHGIHSPFVYNLSDQCLSICKDSNDDLLLKSMSRELKNDNREIVIQDHGAGSRKMKSTRKINTIYNTSSSNGRYGQLLYQLCKYYKPELILEFGTSLGIGTINLALGNPNAKVITVEGCPETHSIAQEYFNKFNLENINSIQSTFIDYIKTLNNEKFDLIFIDGHHDGNALLNYLEMLLPYTHTDTLFILDDIRWSDDMLKAWNKIIKDERIHLTIDFFRMGIVALRPQQIKQHFILRF